MKEKHYLERLSRSVEPGWNIKRNSKSILKKKYEKCISKEIWKGFERETLSRAHVLSRSVEPGSAARTLSEGMAAAAWAKAFLKRKEFQTMSKKAWMAAWAKALKKKIF